MASFALLNLWLANCYFAHYHEERNHQGKNNVLLFPLPTQGVRGEQEKVRCRERLGGLLKYYEREAA
jgi:putative transposase